MWTGNGNLDFKPVNKYVEASIGTHVPISTTDIIFDAGKGLQMRTHYTPVNRKSSNLTITRVLVWYMIF